MARVETMSISEFMAGSNNWRKEQKQIEKVLKNSQKRVKKILDNKGLSTSALLPVVAVLSYPAHPAHASINNVQAVPVNVVSDAVNGVVFGKIMDAFAPLLGLLQAIAHPLCLLGMTAGCLFWMLNQKEKGLSMITNAGIGYILVQLMPFLMSMLEEITKTL